LWVAGVLVGSRNYRFMPSSGLVGVWAGGDHDGHGDAANGAVGCRLDPCYVDAPSSPVDWSAWLALCFELSFNVCGLVWSVFWVCSVVV